MFIQVNGFVYDKWNHYSVMGVIQFGSAVIGKSFENSIEQWPRTFLCVSILFCSVLFCSVLFCSVLFCSVLFSAVCAYEEHSFINCVLHCKVIIPPIFASVRCCHLLPVL